MRLRYRAITYVPGGGRQVDEMERLFREAWSLTHVQGRHSAPSWYPPLDMYERPDCYVVRLELAGAREEELDVTLSAEQLVISGRRVPEHTRAGEQVAYHMAGIRYGEFRVALRVPPDVDPEAGTANYDSGFLTITLPKRVQNVEKIERA
jgi:HSP20 family protein